MGSKTKRLSRHAVEGLEPASKVYQVRDTKLTGFLVRVHPSGRKTYCVEYRANGRHRLYKLGVHGQTYTYDQARKAAASIIGRVERGEDPAADRARGRVAGRFRISELCDRFISDHVTVKASTREAYRQLCDYHIKDKLGDVPVANLTRADVAQFHAGITRSGSPGAANKATQLLGSIYRWAIRLELYDGKNPAEHITMNKPQRRGVALTQAQRQALYEALRDAEARPPMTGGWLPHGFTDAVRLLLVTGMRLGEACTLEWEWVKLGERPRLELPTSKTGPKTVWLDATAVEIIRRRVAADESDRLVFSTPEGRPLRGRWHRRWATIREAAGLPKSITTHSMRHSYVSEAAMAGVSTEITMAVLGMESPSTVRRYRHLANESIQDAVLKTASRVAPKKIK